MPELDAETRLANLEAKEEVREFIASYCAISDRIDKIGDLVDLFTEDAVLRNPAGVHPGVRAHGEPGDQSRGGGHDAGADPHTPAAAFEGRDRDAGEGSGRAVRIDAQLLRSRSGRTSVRDLRFVSAASEGF